MRGGLAGGENVDLPAAVRSFDQGLVDIAEQLIARFGGELIEHWAERVPEPA